MGFDSAEEERQAHYPEQGYNLVEMDMMKPPGEALTKIGHSLRLSELTIPPTTDLTDYVVYDKDGNDYGRESVSELPDSDNSEELEELIESIRVDEGRERRIALARLAKTVERDPECGLDVIPILTSELRAFEIELQVESLHILSTVAEEYPEQVTPTASEVVPLLDVGGDSGLIPDAVQIISAIAEYEPDAVVDAVPKLATLLQADSPAEPTVLTALKRIADVYPDAVVPITPDLITYIEQGSDSNRIGAIAVLGTLSKDYPHIAEETIPTATELLNAENHMLRANATGLLADLSDEYPAEVRASVPRVIDLLDDDDEKVRYNATSILARVAKQYPEDVEPAIPSLIDALDEDFEYSRGNACWALGYVEADLALDALEERRQVDSSEEVRNAAEQAIQLIEEES
ncbi:HEAT repeat domain-containing protein [Halobellus ordinarius]|uniref:HEAT repeat domain-containing protein n=1 Tax=Halobellus ordinarius TaxID=3075120 RepID=UPI0028809BC6|nr:HEAT repeat domain-containing protein [Halobellus sp. ZY16]